MLILRCTTKAFKKLGSKPPTGEVGSSASDLGPWYVNTIDYLNGGDMLLACMHTESLLVLLVPLGPEPSAESFIEDFLRRLLQCLLNMGIDPGTAERIVAGYGGSAVLARNRDRRIAGHMNAVVQEVDFMLETRYHDVVVGGRLDAQAVESRINTTPRDCSKQRTIWPLQDFWQCLRRLAPQLPPATVMPGIRLSERELDKAEYVLMKMLPSELLGKVFSCLEGTDRMWTAHDLRTIIVASAPDSDLSGELPNGAARLHDLATFRLERLETTFGPDTVAGQGGQACDERALQPGATDQSSQGQGRQRTMYKVRITLRDTQPPIWRLVTMPADLRLGLVHDVIQQAMGWDDYHLHDFRQPGPGGRPGRIFEPITDPEGNPVEARGQDENSVTLADVCPDVGRKLTYVYDFGDGWRHTIEVKSIYTTCDEEACPACVAGARACPPEDCGGPPGFAQLLEALEDPQSATPRQRGLVEWAGDFDPRAFSAESVTHRLRRWWRRVIR